MAFTAHEEYFASVCLPTRAVSSNPFRRKSRRRYPWPPGASATTCPRSSRHAFFYFAAFKKHIGIYPPVTQDAQLIQELAPYRGEKGNLSFPLGEPLPIDLIGRVAVALSREYARAPQR